MHVECPKDFKFCLPVSWVTTLTMQDTTRDVISSRYENTTLVGQNHYMVCCGAIKGQGPQGQKGHMKNCYKEEVASHKERLATRPDPVRTAPFVKVAAPLPHPAPPPPHRHPTPPHLQPDPSSAHPHPIHTPFPLHLHPAKHSYTHLTMTHICVCEQVARKEYLVTVKKAICPLIQNYMIEDKSPSGAPAMHKAIPTECKAWSATIGHKRKRPGQCEPGEFCVRRCSLLPCIAIRLGRPEELAARETYQAAVSTPGSSDMQ